MHAVLTSRLNKRQEEGILRHLKVPLKGIDFASNDYLGFARSSELKNNILQAYSQMTHLGSTGSRLLSGNSPLCEQLESELAAYHGAESALLFSSGYAANIGVITALSGQDVTFLYDAKVHASTRDGIRLSASRSYPWRHNDMDHLEELLKKTKHAIVLAESIYSTDGSTAPLELESLCERYEAPLVLDEAHAGGIFPPRKAFARVYTFGKSLGVAGGVVVGSHLLRHSLINFARSFIYTTAMPEYALLAIRTAYSYLKRREDLVEKLHTLMRHAKIASPIRVISHPQARQKAAELERRGFQVCALLPPTASEPTMRITLHAFNTEKEYDALCLQLS